MAKLTKEQMDDLDKDWMPRKEVEDKYIEKDKIPKLIEKQIEKLAHKCPKCGQEMSIQPTKEKK